MLASRMPGEIFQAAAGSAAIRCCSPSSACLKSRKAWTGSGGYDGHAELAGEFGMGVRHMDRGAFVAHVDDSDS